MNQMMEALLKAKVVTPEVVEEKRRQEDKLREKLQREQLKKLAKTLMVEDPYDSQG